MNLGKSQIFELNKKVAKFWAAELWRSHCNPQFDKTTIIFFHSPSQQQKNVTCYAGSRY